MIPSTPPTGKRVTFADEQPTTNTTIEPRGALALPVRTTTNGAATPPRASLDSVLRAQVDAVGTEVNVPPLPTAEDFTHSPLPAPSNPLRVSELLLMIAADLSPLDRLSFSRMNQQARYALQGDVVDGARQLLRAVRTAVRQAIANNRPGSVNEMFRGSVKEMFREIRLQNAHFLGRDTTLGQLGAAFGLQDATHPQILCAFVAAIPHFPPSRFARGDLQLECVYVARSLLQVIDTTPGDLNRVLTSALDIVPRVHGGRHVNPSEYSERASVRAASPFFGLGEATCGLTVPVGLVVAGVAGAVVAAGSPFVKEDKTTGRAINLAVEAMDRLLPGELEDRSVQQITRLLVGAPGGKGKHLRKLRDAMTTKATEQQMASVHQQLQGAGWMPRPRGG